MPFGKFCAFEKVHLFGFFSTLLLTTNASASIQRQSWGDTRSKIAIFVSMVSNASCKVAMDYMSNNALSGTIPHESLSMGKLYTIQLNNNLLEGGFPFQEVKEGAAILGNLWIQENADLTGTITEAYCGLNSITLNCDNYGPKPMYGSDGNKLRGADLEQAEGIHLHFDELVLIRIDRRW